MSAAVGEEAFLPVADTVVAAMLEI